MLSSFSCQDSSRWLTLQLSITLNKHFSLSILSLISSLRYQCLVSVCRYEVFFFYLCFFLPCLTRVPTFFFYFCVILVMNPYCDINRLKIKTSPPIHLSVALPTICFLLFVITDNFRSQVSRPRSFPPVLRGAEGEEVPRGTSHHHGWERISFEVIPLKFLTNLHSHCARKICSIFISYSRQCTVVQGCDYVIHKGRVGGFVWRWEYDLSNYGERYQLTEQLGGTEIAHWKLCVSQ